MKKDKDLENIFKIGEHVRLLKDININLTNGLSENVCNFITIEKGTIGTITSLEVFLCFYVKFSIFNGISYTCKINARHLEVVK
jgi:hypothetical protein